MCSVSEHALLSQRMAEPAFVRPAPLGLPKTICVRVMYNNSHLVKWAACIVALLFVVSGSCSVQ